MLGLVLGLVFLHRQRSSTTSWKVVGRLRVDLPFEKVLDHMRVESGLDPAFGKAVCKMRVGPGFDPSFGKAVCQMRVEPGFDHPFGKVVCHMMVEPGFDPALGKWCKVNGGSTPTEDQSTSSDRAPTLHRESCFPK